MNRAITVPSIALGDAFLRTVNAGVHGGAALLGQGAGELGPGNGRVPERDILGMAQISMGGAGRLGGVVANSHGALRQAENAARTGVRSLHRHHHTGRVARQLHRAKPKTTNFGKVDTILLNDINRIRALEGQPKIGTRDIRIYANVLTY